MEDEIENVATYVVQYKNTTSDTQVDAAVGRDGFSQATDENVQALKAAENAGVLDLLMTRSDVNLLSPQDHRIFDLDRDADEAPLFVQGDVPHLVFVPGDETRTVELGVVSISAYDLEEYGRIIRIEEEGGFLSLEQKATLTIIEESFADVVNGEVATVAMAAVRQEAVLAVQAAGVTGGDVVDTLPKGSSVPKDVDVEAEKALAANERGN